MMATDGELRAASTVDTPVVGPLPPFPKTAAMITLPGGTLTSATPFANPGQELLVALGKVPMTWRLAWVSAIGAAVLLFLGYIVVATISYNNPQAHAILNAVGEKGWIFLAGLALPSPALALARKL